MSHILVVEDDDQFREMIRAVLEQAGYEVRIAEDGEKALRLLRQQAADLVVTDIVMPNKEGLETIIELRKSFCEVKIIGISGAGGEGPRSYLRMAERLGADRTFTKPLNLPQFLDAVRELSA
jgi:DNA-binding response OmpR family regulator